MTSSESAQILTQLVSLYPQVRADDKTVKAYRQRISGLDFESAVRAVELWTKTERYFPTIAEFMEAYRRARREAAQPADKPQPHTGPPPEWIWVWRWSIDTGRVPAGSHFPQFTVKPGDDEPMGRYVPPHTVTWDEYDELLAAWTENGQPKTNLLAQTTKPIPEPADA